MAEQLLPEYEIVEEHAAFLEVGDTIELWSDAEQGLVPVRIEHLYVTPITYTVVINGGEYTCAGRTKLRRRDYG